MNANPPVVPKPENALKAVLGKLEVLRGGQNE